MKKRFCEKKAFCSSGFTLVELLVVISVIAVLMGILMPILSRARASATSTACRANLRSIAFAFVMYLEDNRDVMPTASVKPFEGSEYPSIMDFLMRYLSEPKVFKCPGDTRDHYYDDFGTSYLYNATLGGTTVLKSFFANIFHFEAVDIHVMWDCRPFHGKEGKTGSVNYLYADGHVSDRTEQN